MLKLFFEETYITVIPAYKETLVHSHNMLRVFFGSEELSLYVNGKKFSGNLIILENDVEHKSPDGEQVYIGKGEENYFDGHVCRMIKLGIPLMNPARLRDGYITVSD